MSQVTRILQAVQGGDPKAAEELLPLVYEELRRLAAAKMSMEAPGQTLQATALMHEAWLRLAGQRTPSRTRRMPFAAACVGFAQMIARSSVVRFCFAFLAISALMVLGLYVRT